MHCPAREGWKARSSHGVLNAVVKRTPPTGGIVRLGRSKVKTGMMHGLIYRSAVLLALSYSCCAAYSPPCFQGRPYTYSPRMSNQEVSQETDAAACQARCAGAYVPFVQTCKLCRVRVSKAEVPAERCVPAGCCGRRGGHDRRLRLQVLHLRPNQPRV